MRVREVAHRLPDESYRGERTVAFTAVIQGRYPAFASPEVVDPLVELLARSASEFSCFVPIYCFMPDHVHIMLKGIGDEGHPLHAMRYFKRLSGQRFARLGLPFRWQKDFHDHIVRDHEDWRAQARYIAQNPVRAALVDSVFEHPFTGSIGTDLSEIVFPMV